MDISCALFLMAQKAIKENPQATRADFQKVVEDATGLKLEDDSAEAIWTDAAKKFVERPTAEDSKIKALKNKAADQTRKAEESSPGDLAISVFRSALLASARPLQASLVGNIVSNVTEGAARFLSTSADYLLGLRTGERTETYVGWLAGKKASWSPGTVKEIWDTVTKGASTEEHQRLENDHGVNFKPDTILGRGVSWALNFVPSLISAADKPARRENFARSMVKYATIEALNRQGKTLIDGSVMKEAKAILRQPTESVTIQAIMESAAKETEEMLFTNQNAAAKVIDPGSLARSDSATARAMRYPATVILPFVKIGLNTQGRKIEWSPIGLAEGIAYAAHAIATKSVESQRLASKKIGRGTLGTIMMTQAGNMALGYALAQMGVLSSQPQKDDQSVGESLAREGKISAPTPFNAGIRDTYEAAGIQPSSVRVGDRWLSFVDYPQLGWLLFGAAQWERDKASQVKDGKRVGWTPGDQMSTYAAYLAGTVNDTPQYRGLSNLFDATRTLKNDEGSLDEKLTHNSFLRGVGGMPTPAIVTDVSGDPYQREAQTIGEGLKSDIPGQRQELPIRYDSLGRPVKREAGVLNQVRGLSPDQGDKLHDPVAQELARLQIPNKKPGPVRDPSRVDADLDTADLADRRKRIGTVLYDNLRELINDPYYKALTDPEKREELTAELKASKSDGSKDIRAEREEKRDPLGKRIK